MVAPDRLSVHPDGLWTPDLAAAVQAHDDATAARREREALEASSRAMLQQVERERLNREASTLLAPLACLRTPGSSLTSCTRTCRPRATDPSPGTFENWRSAHPDAVSWSPPGGWAWSKGLAEPDRLTAELIAYLTQRIYESGPVSMFALPDAGDLEDVLASLRQAGLIRLVERSGIRRWERLPGA
jgi:hypothetical protein